ncbi:hypothetical protein Hanom_Chr12g01071571 [Helianthus anomalus]
MKGKRVILDLDPRFSKSTRIGFLTHIIPNFCQKYTDGPCGLLYVPHLVAN